jgi:7,8-dihydropterin-6-yl-methyl-4-(beta-D-ribofuranosyl)aminobenzene 5'-phosphate synthase
MPDFSPASSSRRTVLAMAGAGALGLAARGLSATPTLVVPQVDRLTLQVIDDAATFGPFLENITRPGLSVVRAGNGGPANIPRMLPRALVGEFGLSILGKSVVGSSERRVLIDFGYSKETLLTNMQLLGIDPMTIDAAVLSHGHLDHYGGYTALYGKAAPNAHRIPLFVGGEEAFCERVAMIGNPPPVMGTLDRAALSKAGFNVMIRPDPAVVARHGFTTGIIPLSGFERAAIPTRMRPGIGCDRAGLDPAKRAETELPDDGEHELATCYAVKGLGLVVVASCSHRGVINSVRRAQAISGIEKVHAVLGGFHLVRPRTEDDARRTVAEFALIDPTYIVPMHCTGEVFIAEALRVMPQKVVRSYVGSQFIFSNSV